MKFSVIVPIYNVELYLRECIDSVLNQSYANFELILVDDGSPDNSAAICDEYAEKDPRVRVIHKQNGGLVSARKAGVEVAIGEYAVCLDGDDFLHSDCLRIIYEKVSKNPGVDVLCFGFCLYFGNKQILKPFSSFYHGYYSGDQLVNEIFPNLLYSKLSRGFPHTICGKAIRLNLYKKYQMKVSSDISMGEDAACMHPLLANLKSIYIIKDCLYYYRQIITSMSKAKKPLSWDNYDKIFALYEEEIDLNKYDFRIQYYRLRTHNLFNIVMSQFYSDRPYKQIVLDILARFKEHPEYDVAINNSNFDTRLMKVIKRLLRNKNFRIINLYAKNRQLIKSIKDRICKFTDR